MRLIYAIAFAVFFVAVPMGSPAQSLDLSLLSAQCTDDYYEDTVGPCDALSAGEVLTIEAILARYGIIITGRTDDEIIAFYFRRPRRRAGWFDSAPERRRSSNRRRPFQRAAGYNRF